MVSGIGVKGFLNSIFISEFLDTQFGCLFDVRKPQNLGMLLL